MTVIAVQILLASPFLSHDKWAYLNSAFDLKRVFMYKWTVNWRFLSEDTFLSHYWAAGLLVAHAAALVSFGLFRWCNPDGGVWTVLNRGVRSPYLPAGQARITADCNFFSLSYEHMLNLVHKMSRQFYSLPISLASYLLDRCITNSIHGMHTKFHSLLGGLHIQLSSGEFNLLNIRRARFEIIYFQTQYNARHRVCLECVPFHVVFILGSTWGKSSSSGRSMASQRDG